jgi:hypothetical protein
LLHHRILSALAEHGLLLLQDKRLPNLVTIVTGEAVAGSWWGHPRGRDIFAALQLLAEHPDVVSTKLLGGKVTFVHRRLWPALVAVATANQPWQTRGLSTAARGLQRQLAGGKPIEASGAAAKELESRLLARADEVHTESGAHHQILESWMVWAARLGVAAKLSEAAAVTELEKAVRGLGADLDALPWRRTQRERTSLRTRGSAASPRPPRRTK